MNYLKKQMNEMQTTLQGMSKLKHRLHEQSDDFKNKLIIGAEEAKKENSEKVANGGESISPSGLLNQVYIEKKGLQSRPRPSHRATKADR